MKRILVLASMLAAVMFAAAPAHAAAVLDFGTGAAGTGGTIQVLADGSILGTAIPVAQLTVSGTGATDGGYIVSGSATGTGTAPFYPSGSYYGSLNFYTGGVGGATYINIVGCVLGLGVGDGTPNFDCSSPVTLLSGTITSFDSSHLSQGLVDATGIDSKNGTLLEALGLAPDTQFAFFGFSLATNPLSVGGNSTAISTDIKNTAVPEPTSLLLLGSGLAGLAGAARRRRARKASN